MYIPPMKKNQIVTDVTIYVQMMIFAEGYAGQNVVGVDIHER